MGKVKIDGKEIKDKNPKYDRNELARRTAKAQGEQNKQIMTSQLIDKLVRQEKFKLCYFDRVTDQEELKIIEAQIELGEKDPSKIEMQWSGMNYPLALLKVLYERQRVDYVKKVREEIYLIEALKRDGLSQKDIMDVTLGKYTKDEDAKNELEKQ